MADTGTTAPAIPGVGDPATGTTPAADVKYVAADELEGYKKFANKELAGLRRGMESLLTEEKLNEILEARLPKPAATGSEKSAKSLIDEEARREIAALKELNAEKDRKLAEEKINSAIRDATKGVIEDAEYIVQDHLRARAKLDRDGFVVIETDDGLQRVTPEYVRSMKGSDTFFPATGRPGSGLREVGRGAGSPGVDVDRAMKDQAYFEANQQAVLDAIHRARGAG